MPIELGETDQQLVRRLKIVGTIAAGIAVLAVIVGIADRVFVNRAVARWTVAQTIPTVATIVARQSSGTNKLVLPGTLQAYYNAPIYARVPGYLKTWYKDIGAHVRKGDVLGVIETPDLDQQIEQARADLANAVAARELSQTTAKRWAGLLALDAVSKQEEEEKSSDLQAKTALVAAAQANLDRLNDLKSFAKIVAPFNGVVTNRSVDVGALINVGAQASPPLFTVANIQRIRVYVSVPQNYSAEIRPGATATLELPEYPGRNFTAKLSADADAISEKSDSLLVEFLADNADGALKPGDYAQVTIDVPSRGTTETIPSSALIFNDRGLQVATVQGNDRIRMKHVDIARDLGAEVEIDSGLGSRDRIVNNPPDSIADGNLVRIQSANVTSTQ